MAFNEEAIPSSSTMPESAVFSARTSGMEDPGYWKWIASQTQCEIYWHLTIFRVDCAEVIVFSRTAKKQETACADFISDSVGGKLDWISLRCVFFGTLGVRRCPGGRVPPCSTPGYAPRQMHRRWLVLTRSRCRKYRYLSVETFCSWHELVSEGLFYKDHFP